MEAAFKLLLIVYWLRSKIVVEKTFLPFGTVPIDANTLHYCMLRFRKVFIDELLDIFFFPIIFYPSLSVLKDLGCEVGGEHSRFQEDLMNKF